MGNLEGAKGAVQTEGAACAKALWWDLGRPARMLAWREWSEPGRGRVIGDEASVWVLFYVQKPLAF